MTVYCKNAEEIKTAILSGEIARADRQTGKTAMLLEVIHEKHNGEATVLFPSSNEAYLFRRRYADKYRQLEAGPVPSCRVAMTGSVRGCSVYVDGWDRLTDRVRDDIAPAVIAGVC